MRKLVIDSVRPDGTVILGKKQSHHLVSVLRLGEGAVLEGTGISGEMLDLKIESVRNGIVTLKVTGQHMERLNENETEIVLVQSLLKGQKMDGVVRQATEAGAARIIVTESENCVARIGDDDGSSKLSRWTRIANEALEQSGSKMVTRVTGPLPFQEALAEARAGGGEAVSLFFHEKKLEETPLHGYLVGRPRRVVMCIGPEGGFSENETRTLLSNGFRPAWLGPNVLRAETAAIFAVASVKTILLETDSWKPST